MKRMMMLLLVLALLSGCAGSTLEANPYSPEDFGYAGDYLTCLAGESRLGVDVSSHQGAIDWEAVAAAGVEFAMIRIGYRGYEQGRICEDAFARTNLEGARAAGLEVGAYFFSQAVSTEEAAGEAAWCVAFLEEQALQLPLVYDWEHVSDPDARTAGLVDRELLTACAGTFLDAVRVAGYDPMVYFNGYQSRELYDLNALGDYGFWYAQYSQGLDFPYAVELWQYTDGGSVPGISGKVDLDLWLSERE